MARSAHFTGYSNAAESQLRQAVIDLERFAQALKVILPNTTTVPNTELTYYLFRRERGFKEMLPKKWRNQPVGGFLQYTPEGSFGASHLANWGQPKETLYHEYTHHFLRQNFSPLPPWANEGLAQYFSTFVIDGDSVRFGMPHERSLLLIRRYGLMNVEDLLNHGGPMEEIHDREGTAVFYAQSWVLVHYLMLGDIERKADFFAYIEAIQAGQESERAFAATFKCSPSELKAELKDYMTRPQIRTLKYPVDKLEFDETMTMRSMSDGEALCALGELLIHIDESLFNQAEMHFKAAGNLDTDNACVDRGLALVEARRGKWKEARSTIAAAIEIEPENPQAWFRAGYIELIRLKAIIEEDPDGADPDDFESARKFIERSLALEANSPAAWTALGSAYSLDPSPPVGGVAAIEQAIKLRGPSSTLIDDLVTVHIKQGDRESARRIFEESLRGRRPAADFAEIEADLVALELDFIVALVANGEECRALKSLTSLLEVTENEATRNLLIEHARKLRESVDSASCRSTG